MAGSEGGRAAPSLAGRFAAAIALTIGFYVLALVIALALIGLPVYGWVEAGRGNVWITIFGVVTGSRFSPRSCRGACRSPRPARRSTPRTSRG